MDIRYQVFVSSTYADLQDARRRVIQTLMEIDCIPAGMELFPAADEEQWAFIQRVIDDCDYYLLIIGGRYGSLTAEGVSYTEMEYEYALKIGQPILAFLHGNPDELPPEMADGDPTLREKLDHFRQKVSTGRLVRLWQQPGELPGLVALSLQKTIKSHPGVGWIRGDQISSQEALIDLNELRKRNDTLLEQVARLESQLATVPKIEGLAPLAQPVELSGECFLSGYGWRPWKKEISWRDLFALIAPYLLGHPHDDQVKATLGKSLFGLTGKSSSTHEPRMNDQDFQTVKIQLIAQNLVSVDYLKSTTGVMGLFWSLTRSGNTALLDLRTVRT